MLPAPVRAADGDIVTAALPVVVPSEFNGDLSRTAARLPAGAPRAERPYRPMLAPPANTKTELPAALLDKRAGSPMALTTAMPGPTQNFEGIARLDTCTGGQCGNGTPPDTNGEVGPNHYIQSVNAAYGIYGKTGTLLASFTEDQLWTGDASICNGESFGDPIVLYDALADRWILTHFAFALSGANTVQPYFQCIAVSKTADPVAGGWWRYAVRTDDASHPWLNDYGKFGIWSDCLYMSANEFTGAGSFTGTLFASFSRADMYAGLPLTSSIGYITNTTDPFSMVPAHLGGQAGGALPAGTPNYFVSESQTAFRFEVRKFTAGPNCGAGGTLGAATLVTQTSYSLGGGAIAPQPGTTNRLDVIDDRVMQKVQYRKIGAQESLWIAHIFRASAAGVTGIQWAQIDVTGGTIGTTPLQQQKYDPADGLYRFMPSLAIDGQGNMAVGYTTSSGTAPHYPSIAYSGRLAGDAANTLGQAETVLVAGGGAQTGNCGGAPCDRWGDYSGMSMDPSDDCTFWLTSEYYPGPPDPNTIAWHTRIGSFKFPGCAASNRSADLALTKTDGTNAAVAGGAITYTIVVSNNGPFAVTGATVTDTLPAAITGATWTCTASAGNGCPASGSGSIATSAVNLMKGGTATFTIHGTVSPAATGSLSNTATVAVPSGFTDPVSGNNAATDVDTISSPAAPTIAMNFVPGTIVIGQTSVLTIGITNPNAGIALTGIAFADTLPAGVNAVNASGPGCGGTVTISANVIALSAGSLAAAGNCSIPVTVTGAQAQAGAWVNTITSITSTESGTNATPASANITVNTAATTTAIVSGVPDPSVVGQAYTVTYGVAVSAPGAGTPTGTVTVSDGVAICTGTLPATSCQLSSTSAGGKSLSVTYNGDVNFNGSLSPSAAHQVNKAGTVTVIVSDLPDPTAIGQSYTVTYGVSAAAPGAGGPTGAVTVSDGADQCIGILPAVSCQMPSVTSGTKLLTATYSGNANFNGSVSASTPHSIAVTGTTTTIVSDTPHPSVVGTAVAVAASVVLSPPGPGTPTGTIGISDGVDGCTITLPATSCNWTPTNVGTRMLNASYSGGGNFGASVSAPLAHVVVAAGDVSNLTVTRRGSGQVASDDGNIVCGATCTHAYANGSMVSLTATPGAGSVFTGWLGACTGTGGCALALAGDTAVSATFAPSAIGTHTLDVDDNGTYDPLTDGLLVLRRLFGLTGTSVTNGAIGSGALRFTPADIATYLDDVNPKLDIDGNGRVDALTDGLLIVRYLLGLRGASLIQGAVGDGATRASTTEIETYLQSLMP